MASRNNTSHVSAPLSSSLSQEMAAIQSLPQDIVLYLLEYVDYRSKLELGSSCREWAHILLKNNIRKIASKNHSNKFTRDGVALRTFTDRIKALIGKPFDQFTLVQNPPHNSGYSALSASDLILILQEIDDSLHYLRCRAVDFIEVMTATNRLKVKRLTIDGITAIANYAEIEESLSKVIDCQSLSLKFASDYPNLSLSMLKSMLSYPIHSLHHLYLSQCPITDVSCLGSIPHLVLSNCKQLVDISTLNNNDHVYIDSCKQIQDYSQSFANSRIIEIDVAGSSDINLDMSKWTKVEKLFLSDDICEGFTGTASMSKIRQALPNSVKTCFLQGSFVSSIDFTVTSDHILSELILSNDNSILSLEGYGFEKVATIAFYNLNSLESLEGLGRGRNRKITINNCHSITDFTPLNHVPIVAITGCKGFTDPLQVRCVRDLVISSKGGISFKPHPIPEKNPYENIHSLSLFVTGGNFTNFDEIKTIPHLEFTVYSSEWIELFFKTGKKLMNQRIVFQIYVDKPLSPSLLADIHEQYMKEDYDFYRKDRRYITTWIWVRRWLHQLS